MAEGNESSNNPDIKRESSLPAHAIELSGLSNWHKAGRAIRDEWRGLKTGKVLFLFLFGVAAFFGNKYIVSPLRAENHDLKNQIAGLNSELAPYKAVDRITKSLFPSSTPDARIDKILDLLTQSVQGDDLVVFVNEIEVREGNAVKSGTTVRSGHDIAIKIKNKGKLPAQRLTALVSFSNLPDKKVTCPSPYWTPHGATEIQNDNGEKRQASTWSVVSEIDISGKDAFLAPPVTIQDDVHGQVGLVIRTYSAKSEQKSFVCVLDIP